MVSGCFGCLWKRVNNHYLLLSINRENSDEPKKSDANHVKSLPAGVGPLEGHFFGDVNFVFLGWTPTTTSCILRRWGIPWFHLAWAPAQDGVRQLLKQSDLTRRVASRWGVRKAWLKSGKGSPWSKVAGDSPCDALRMLRARWLEAICL